MEVLEIKFTVFLIIEVSAWIFRNTILVLYLLENTRILSNQIPMVYILISGVIQPDTHGLRPHIWSYPARCPWFTSWYLELSSQISKAYILISGVIQPDTHGLHPDIWSYPARYLRLTSWYLELSSQISVVIQSDILGLHSDIRSYPVRHPRFTSWYPELSSQTPKVYVKPDI